MIRKGSLVKVSPIAIGGYQVWGRAVVQSVSGSSVTLKPFGRKATQTVDIRYVKLWKGKTNPS